MITQYFSPLLNPIQRILYQSAVVIWFAALVYFWVWWLDPAHSIGNGRFALVSLILVWVTLGPSYLVAIFGNSRISSPGLSIRPGSKVAMVVTKAPSEPFHVVARTLEAMLRQTYPHDTWLADEAPDANTMKWCRVRGVMVSSRAGHADYHRAYWPRRTRCKEGNLAFFYDRFGYDNYDFVSQFDADHIPSNTYLEAILRPFADPAVGYVSAPSICDNNADESWSARARLYVEATLHGALQAGYNNGWAPLCIGSHYAVRTAALKQIGGLGPELAEDHSTTLLMNAHGWNGVHAIDAIAHGDGPRAFPDLAVQEFQWSRSLTMILITYFPIFVGFLSGKKQFQFLFSQLWYALSSVFMAIMVLLPLPALIFDFNYVNVEFVDFVAHITPLSLVLVAMAIGWKAGGWCRPVGAKVVSWEGVLFLFARWPWALAGAIAAVWDRATGSTAQFSVTPKAGSASALPVRVLAPYAALVLVSAASVLLASHTEVARGYYIFASANALIYTLLIAIIVIKHATESGAAFRMHPRSLVMQASLILALAGMSGAAGSLRGAAGLEALTWGIPQLAITSLTFSVAGAGHGGESLRRLKSFPEWIARHK